MYTVIDLIVIYKNNFFSVSRFTCQLAITEVNYNQIETDICPSTSQQQPLPHPTPPDFRKLNFEFAVDLDSHLSKRQNASIDSIPHHIDSVHLRCERRPRSDSASGRLNTGSPLLRRRRSDSANAAMNVNAAHPPKKPRDQKANVEVFDTFEQCLHVTNQMESIMAYHYQDEDNKDCYRFEEIYSFREGDIDLVTFMKQTDNSAFKEEADVTFDPEHTGSQEGACRWKSTSHLESDIEEFVGQRSDVLFHRHGKMEAAS